MPGRRARQPAWLTRVVIDAIHTEQIREHGGLPGIRDENALEAALGRPRHKWSYGENIDLAALAAAYGFGLVRGHPYRDGNKRIGFLAVFTFLGLNGKTLRASDAEVVGEIVALAAGHVSEAEFASWIRDRVAGRRA